MYESTFYGAQASSSQLDSWTDSGGLDMEFREFLDSFHHLLEASPRETIGPESSYVFMSDLHLGDGGRKDDLAPNRGIVLSALAEWYLPKGHTLVLNGDIEDLSKFRYREIREAWKGLYGLLDEFSDSGRLRRILGNHDLALLARDDYPYELSHGLALDWKGRTLFAFHGHQASRFFMEFDYLSEFIVRYLAKPLSIKNTSISGDSRRRFRTERRIYRASRRLGIASIAGHTHRPLFESLSKYDSLRWSIEELLRAWPGADDLGKTGIEKTIAVYRTELGRLRKHEKALRLSTSLYDEGDIIVPSLFNSGCATGRHGITAIEIEAGSISLVQWTGTKGPRDYVNLESLDRSEISETPYARHVLRRAALDEVFARIDLLTPSRD